MQFFLLLFRKIILRELINRRKIEEKNRRIRYRKISNLESNQEEGIGSKIMFFYKLWNYFSYF